MKNGKKTPELIKCHEMSIAHAILATMCASTDSSRRGVDYFKANCGNTICIDCMLNIDGSEHAMYEGEELIPNDTAMNRLRAVMNHIEKTEVETKE